MSIKKRKEVIVIGAGPGGYVASIRLAQLGKQVMLVDKNYVGGICLNEGCIPSKALIQVANIFESLKTLDKFGIEINSVPQINYSKLQTWKEGVVQKLTTGIEYLLKKNGVDFQRGKARFVNADVIEIEGEAGSYTIEADNILIATGSVPTALPFLPIDRKNIITSTEALTLPTIPKSMVVVGGGVIGLEIGTMYAKLGTQVTIIELFNQLLPGVDQDIVSVIERNLKKRKIKYYIESKVTEAKTVPNGLINVNVITPKGGVSIEAEKVLVAVGRKPNTKNLHLENAGIAIDDNGCIVVGNDLQTSVNNIYAIGDVIDGPQLAHRASKEGLIVAEIIAGKDQIVDYKAMPAVIFCEPEVATVGLTEAQAMEKSIRFNIGEFPFTASGRALASGSTDGFVKIISDAQTDLLLGVHIVGPHASELIAEAALAIETGCLAEDLALVIHAHPTLSETLMEAAEVLHNQGIHLYNPPQAVH